MGKWRIGRSYGIHVYEIGPTSPDADRPVATFFDPLDAERAVASVNAEAVPEEPYPACRDHHEVQHRDGKPPWCEACGWNRGRPAVPPVQVKERP